MQLATQTMVVNFGLAQALTKNIALVVSQCISVRKLGFISNFPKQAENNEVFFVQQQIY